MVKSFPVLYGNCYGILTKKYSDRYDKKVLKRMLKRRNYRKNKVSALKNKLT